MLLLRNQMARLSTFLESYIKWNSHLWHYAETILFTKSDYQSSSLIEARVKILDDVVKCNGLKSPKTIKFYRLYINVSNNFLNPLILLLIL